MTLLFCLALAAAPVQSKFGEGPGPTADGDGWRLLHGVAAEQNVLAWPAVGAGPHRSVHLAFRLRCGEGADGMGVLLLDTAAHGGEGAGPRLEAWEEPNLPGCLGIGIDLYNPPEQNPFNAQGNIYDRPQREVSLHWDGIELYNALSPVEFRDGQPHAWAVDLRYEPGGAFVTVACDGTAIYHDAFVPLAVPYEFRPAVGARSGGLTAELSVSDLVCQVAEPTETATPPVAATVFAGAVLTSNHQTETAEVTLPEMRSARILMRLELAAPPEGGIDPWDRGGAVYVFDGAERYEIQRFITPFGRPYTWVTDVSDYAMLLRGRRRFEVNIQTWTKGWRVRVDLLYFAGAPALEPYRIERLWSGDWDYGNPDQPLDARFEPRELTADAACAAAKLRLWVTGHGMHPATHNAGEFMPADRTVTVGDRRFDNRLWTDDNYLNPCRPQGGTWKYDRAGWGPGAPVRPWDIDLTGLLPAGQAVPVTYVPMPYINEKRAEARASHWVEGQVIYYRRPEA